MADINEREKKTPEQIKQRILKALNNKPLNAQGISKAINSNWITAKEYIEELVKDKKVKKISFGNQIVYQKRTDDTYFNIPIKNEQDRDILKFVISNAIRSYRELKKEQIKKTELAKLIYHLNSKLRLNLPIVWYLYGPMPLMVLDLDRDYSTTFIPKNSEEIKKEIAKWIKEKTRMYVKEIVKEIYLQSNAKLYDTKTELFYNIENEKIEKLSELAKEFYLALLSYDFSDSEIVYEFYNIVSGLDFLGKLKNKKIINKILLSLDSIWKYIASKTLYKSLLELRYTKEEADIYIGSIIEMKKYLAEEALNDLEEAYLELLPSEPIQLKGDELSKKISKVMDEWTESEVWRN